MTHQQLCARLHELKPEYKGIKDKRWALTPTVLKFDKPDKYGNQESHGEDYEWKIKLPYNGIHPWKPKLEIPYFDLEYVLDKLPANFIYNSKSLSLSLYKGVSGYTVYYKNISFDDMESYFSSGYEQKDLLTPALEVLIKLIEEGIV